MCDDTNERSAITNAYSVAAHEFCASEAGRAEEPEGKGPRSEKPREQPCSRLVRVATRRRVLAWPSPPSLICSDFWADFQRSLGC